MLSDIHSLVVFFFIPPYSYVNTFTGVLKLIRFKVPYCETALAMANAHGFYNQSDIEAAAKLDMIALNAKVEVGVILHVFNKYTISTPDVISALIGDSLRNWDGLKLGWETPLDMMVEVVTEAKHFNRCRDEDETREPLDQNLINNIKRVLSERW